MIHPARSRKRPCLRWTLAACFPLAIAANAQQIDEAAGAVEVDRALAKQLAAALKTELTAAMSVSPQHAIGVCNERAPKIARKISVEQDVQIGRAALRTRNPANAPIDWQRKVLETFEARIAAGEPLATMEHSEVVRQDGQLERRYMKAIGTEPLCVTCHGVQLSPELQRAILAKYPDDAATGFNVGDLRGAVYVIRRVANPSR